MDVTYDVHPSQACDVTILGMGKLKLDYRHQPLCFVHSLPYYSDNFFSYLSSSDATSYKLICT